MNIKVNGTDDENEEVSVINIGEDENDCHLQRNDEGARRGNSALLRPTDELFISV